MQVLPSWWPDVFWATMRLAASVTLLSLMLMDVYVDSEQHMYLC